MYNNDDIQAMLVEAKNDSELKAKILKGVSDFDRDSVASVIRECWYEEFDRYDSDVCEQFITAYEKAKGK